MRQISPSLPALCLAAGVAAIALSGCSSKDKGHGDGHGEAAHGGEHGEVVPATLHHWSYEGKEGPDHWAELGGENAVCKSGHRQSPIDIAGITKQRSAKVIFNYQPSAATIQNNGHTIQIALTDAGGITVDGVPYKLKQFHFHSPSEHAINGHRAVLETHFVHQNDKGDLLVIGVLSDIGAADPMLGSLWTYLPTDAGKPVPLADLLINPQDLMPATEDFYVYSGSLTTPPCKEGVTWMVYSSPLSVSAEQADAFERLVGPNSRPIQARNERDFLHVTGS